MATPFKDIYARAIFRFADYDFLERDLETRQAVLERYLVSAKTEFQRICKTDLSDCDMELKQFNQDLTDEEQEILALGVSFYWLSFKTLNSESLKNVLNSKDYSYYSPANLLEKTKELRTVVRNEFYRAMNRYSYNDGAVKDLAP